MSTTAREWRSPVRRALSTTVALRAVDLVKTYPGKPPVRALDGLSVEVASGTVFGLLGPNGAGKSTTVKIFTTLSRPDSGTAEVAELDVARRAEQVRRAIGLVSQKSSSDPMATGRENLVLAGRLHGMSGRNARKRAAELLERFRLAEAGDRLARTYSGGMARKLDVAIGLMHRPAVLFLDEPTTGLDPEARAEMWIEIERLASGEGTGEQTTVLLTTHYLEEADRLADRLAIVDRGRVVVEGSPDELKSALRGDRVHVELAEKGDAGRAAPLVGNLDGLSYPTVEGPSLIARAQHGAAAVPAVLAALDDAGVPVASVTVARPSLDDVYLSHVGRTFKEDDK
ncbi:MAG TPA: ATP-binding cassette domain-containing protein [Micromonosporaceae bacterium]